MSTLIKTIILNNNTVKNFNAMAVITLSQENNSVYGTLKAYNLNIKDNLVLGIAQNKKQVLKQNISLINNNVYNFKLNNINLNLPLACVLVQDTPTEVIPLMWANEKNDLKTEIMNNFAELKMQNITPKINEVITQSQPKKENIDLSEMFDISHEEEIEEVINSELGNDCFTNEKTDYFNGVKPNYVNNETENYDNVSAKFETANNQTISNPIEDELKNYEFSEETFYESMSEQIEDLFNKYPAETNLENLIPNSKWVKIDYENNGNYYVLGLIYEDIELKYICYGVPGKYAETPPNGLSNYSQFLPLNPESPEDGYWVMYQNAINGESVAVDAI